MGNNIVTNKRTGVEYQMTDKEVQQLKSNPHLSNAFSYKQRAPVPEEVKELRAKRGKPPGANGKKPSE